MKGQATYKTKRALFTAYMQNQADEFKIKLFITCCLQQKSTLISPAKVATIKDISFSTTFLVNLQVITFAADIYLVKNYSNNIEIFFSFHILLINSDMFRWSLWLWTVWNICQHICHRHDNDITRALWCLKSLATPLSVQQLIDVCDRENIKAKHYWPITVKGTTGHWWIPLRKGQ